MQFLAVDVPRVRTVWQHVPDHLINKGRFLDAPIDREYKIAELLFAPQALVARRLAQCVVVNHAVDDAPVSAVALGYDPIREIFAVEQGRKTSVRLGPGNRRE